MPATPNSKLAGSYQRLSLAEKQALQRERMREPAVTCPVCETQTASVDLLGHLQTRCPGPREPNPASKWVTLAEAIALGAPRPTIFRWARRGMVRTQGSWRGRRYLLRDVALRLARRQLARSLTSETLVQRSHE